MKFLSQLSMLSVPEIPATDVKIFRSWGLWSAVGSECCRLAAIRWQCNAVNVFFIVKLYRFMIYKYIITNGMYYI